MRERLEVKIPEKEENAGNIPLHGWKRGGANGINRELIVDQQLHTLSQKVEHRNVREVLDDIIEAIMADIRNTDSTHAFARIASEIELSSILSNARKMKSKGVNEEDIFRYVAQAVNKSVALITFRLSE